MPIHLSRVRRSAVSVALASLAALMLAPSGVSADEPALAQIPRAPITYRERPMSRRDERATRLAAPAEEAPRSTGHRGTRIGFETVGAALGIGASAIVGVFGWGFAGSVICPDMNSPCAVEGAIASGVLASLVLVPLGVIVGSRATRGNGGYLWSVLGAALGIVPGIAGGIWLTQETHDVLSAVPLLGVLTIFGAVLGYELSADPPPTAVERLFTPVALIDASGVRIGLRGTL